jgi:hypothetical protein
MNINKKEKKHEKTKTYKVWRLEFDDWLSAQALFNEACDIKAGRVVGAVVVLHKTLQNVSNLQHLQLVFLVVVDVLLFN